MNEPSGITADVAAEHSLDTVPVVDISATVGDLVALLRGEVYDYCAEAAVSEAGKLVGIVTVEDVLPQPDERPLRELLDRGHAVVRADEDQEMAALEAVARGQRSVAVIDEQGGFMGFVSPRRIQGILFEEHQEDLARHGGFLVGEGSARLASEEPITRRLWHRLPWLLLGVVGAFGMAELIAAFEDVLSRQVSFVFLLPPTVYIAGAVGTQTQILVVRGLAVGADKRVMASREMVTGLLVGIVLAAALVLAVALRWSNGDAAFVVGVAVLAASVGASAVALVLPLFLQLVKVDPAFGTGPLAAVIQDSITIAIYFGAVVMVSS
ncbi:MAG: magnesium transporter [Chloroflexi bacterium]|nr:magnesium transporter [Chloroflexota bacterium]